MTRHREKKKALEYIEKKYIEEYADKYGDKLINKQKNNPNKKPKESKQDREIQYQVEKEEELKKRIAELKEKIEIKDDDVRNYFFYDVKLKGESIKSKARYNENNKDKALMKIQEKKTLLINQLTLSFD